MKSYILSTIILSAAVNPALAGQIEKKDKWILNEVTANDSTVCIASTEDRGFSRTYTLQIQKQKNSSKPVEIFLNEAGKPKYGPMAAASIGNEVVLFNQLSIEAKNQMFWYLPDETKLFLDTLKTSSKTFEVRPYGDLDGGKISFSPKGASQIIASMEKHCNAGKSLVDDRFSALTNHPSAFDTAPKLFDPSHISSLRSIYFELAGHHNNLLQNEARLAKLVEQNLPKITERDSLRVEQANLNGRKIPELKNNIQVTSQRIESGERRLAQLQTEIPNAQKQKDLAQAKYDEAQRQIAPHLPRHNQLSRDLSSAQSDLAESEREISSAQREISDNIRQMDQLDREAQQLNSRIQRLRSDLPSLQSQYDRARRDLESFDSRSETRRRLASSSRYRTAQSDADRVRAQLNSEREELRSLERDLTRSRSQLSQCQSKPGNDCSKLAEQTNRLEADVNTKKSMVSRLQGQYNNAQREVEKIEEDVARDVGREEDQLRAEYDRASARLTNLNSELQQAEGQRRDITEYQIPRLQNRNLDLRAYVSSQESRAASLRQEIRSLADELNRFDQSVGFSRLEQNLNVARSQLQSTSSALSRLVSEDSNLKVQVPKDKILLVQLNDSLKASEARLVAVGQAIVKINSDLAGFDSSKAELESVLASIQSQIDSAKSRYLAFFM